MLCVRFWYQLCVDKKIKRSRKNEKLQEENLVEVTEEKFQFNIFRKMKMEKKGWVDIVRKVNANLKVTDETVRSD